MDKITSAPTPSSSRLPIHDFLNDQEAGFTSRVAAAISSTATSTASAPSTGSSRTTLASFLGGNALLEEEKSGLLVAPPTQRPTYTHQCLFHFLDCAESFDVFEDWRIHVLSHFQGHAAPTEAQCPLCSQKMTDPGRDRAWNFMLWHVAFEHFHVGHTLITSRPDFALYKFLFNRKIIDEPQYKSLFMTKTTGTYLLPTQPNAAGRGPSNTPFVSTLNEARQQRRRWQGRRVPARGPGSGGGASLQRTPGNAHDSQSLNSEKIPDEVKDSQKLKSPQSALQLTYDHQDLERKHVAQTLPPARSNQTEAKECSEGSDCSSTPVILEPKLGDVHTPSTEASRNSLEPQISEMELGSEQSWSDSSAEDADSSSQSSSQGCRSLMSSAKQRLLTELMDIFHAKYDILLGDRIRTYAQSGNDKAADSTSGLGLGGASLTASSKASSGPPRFPPLEREEGDGNMKKPDLPEASKPDTKVQRRYACIFYKHDPIMYHTNGVTGAKYRTCGGPGFESVSRVKEHLYRHHRAPTQCPRCWIELKDYDELTIHLNQAVLCEQQQSKQAEGITVQQYEKLKSKKRACSDQTQEGRWREVYRICFPEETVPTPYYDWDTLGAEVPVLRDIEDLEEYSRRHLRQVFRSRVKAMIDEKLQPIRDELIGAFDEILKSSLSIVSEEWRQKRQCRSPGPGVGGHNSAPQDTVNLPTGPPAAIQRQTRVNFDEFLEMPSTSVDESGDFGLDWTSDLFDIFKFGDNGPSIPGYDNQVQHQQLDLSASEDTTAAQFYGAQAATAPHGDHPPINPTPAGTDLDPTQLQLGNMAFPSSRFENTSAPDNLNPFGLNYPYVSTSSEGGRQRRRKPRSRHSCTT